MRGLLWVTGWALLSQTAPLWHERATSTASGGESVVPSLAPLVKAVKSAVVNVEVATGRGSGFVIDAGGWILTNAHVLGSGPGSSGQVKVRFAAGPPLTAEVVGRDDATDVALLRLLHPPRALPYAFLGDSDRLEVGDWVVAIGNPFGLSQSVSQGILSAKERVLGLGPFDDFLQTDVLMNPGNSGGPLFDLHGEVVGVTTARVSEGQGIGFAIPINLVKDLLPQLQTRGHVARGWLGLTVEELGAPEQGTVVKDVVSGGPAFIAGLRKDDQIVSVGGKPVESYTQLLRQVALSPPGLPLVLRLRRDGQPRQVTAIVAEPLPRRP